MTATFEEAIDQGYVGRNSARKLVLPKQLRATDKTTLTWNQLRLVLAPVTLRDHILLTLDMTETFRPSQSLALRWGDFDLDSHTLTVRRTAFNGKLRDFGETRMSLRTVNKLPQIAQAQRSDEERVHPHGQLPRPCSKKLGVESPGAAAHNCDAGPDQGQRQDVQAFWATASPTLRQTSTYNRSSRGVRQTLDAIYSELVAKSEMAGVA